MPRFRIHHLVGSEFESVRAWYAGYSVLAAERFVDAFHAALGRVQRHPTAHSLWRPPCRRIRLVRFPYLIIYHTDRRQTSALVLAHERREPTHLTVTVEGRLESLE